MLAFRVGSASIRSTSASALERASRAVARKRVSLFTSAVRGSAYASSNAPTYTELASNIEAKADRTVVAAQVGHTA